MTIEQAGCRSFILETFISFISFILEPRRFWISTEEFNERIEEIFHDLGRIKALSSFTINSYTKIRQRRLIDDVKIFSEF